MGTIKKINVNGIEYDLAGSGGAMINVTYSELVSLIGSSSLVQGNKYRITDYVTEFKSWKSAGHQFDIVVEAITEDRIRHLPCYMMEIFISKTVGCPLGRYGMILIMIPVCFMRLKKEARVRYIE